MPVTLWLFAQQTEPLIRRLDPQTRAKVLAALAALVILGLALVLLVWLGARATRRYMNSGRPASSTRPHGSPDDWADKPIVPDYEKPSSEGP
jgi:hypothetical protein